MDNNIQRPLSFGKILDQTFRIIRGYFKPIFLIVFYIMIPVLALQAIILAVTGHKMLIGDDSIQNIWSATATELDMYADYNPIRDFGYFLSMAPIFFATPLIVGAISHVVKRARAGEPAEAVEMIKLTFPRYWPLLGSTLLFGIIAFSIVFASIFAGAFLVAFLAIESAYVIAILLALLMIVGGFIGYGLLFTRWILYLPATLFEKVAPGLGRSWRLTKRQTWKFFGIYVILTILSSIIIGALNFLPALFLGTSIIGNLWTNFVSLISSIILAVAWAIMYFDASLRQDAADIQDLVDTYNT
ncbi:hypothetical protein GGQ92_001964 [Gracilibacillus halotolerans]|uniref:Glycerophosphoryl diester phosphodiesterase membrane domain-containing protein n=1 Tax=Gracilibacillus halotolerans TaxID=74386 RepID=A0A841RQH6_9BACI|nr:hypothetical protein [Gracilibacillus halotolerans]MBB6513174.1 hypothetical protein [Gracilibacillus halotolerans]